MKLSIVICAFNERDSILTILDKVLGVELELGWEKDKAIRDIARKQAFIAAAIMRTGKEYDDGRVTVPATPTGKH